MLSYIEEDNDGYNSRLSDECNNCDMEDGAFLSGYDIGVEYDYDNNFLGDEWEQYQWNPIGDDDNAIGPAMNDC